MSNALHYLVKIEIPEVSRVKERSGVSEKTGKEWLMRNQEAYAHVGKPYPIEIKVPLEKDQAPYGKGLYYLHPSSLKANNYGELQVGDIILIPVDEK